MKKRIILTAAIAVMVLLTAAGCSGGDSSSEGSSQPSADFSQFQAEDLEGNAVDGSVLKDAELTVLNLWGTFCGPCIKEMPDLGQLSRDYKGKGIQIIGIPVDVNSESTQETAKEIVASTKADYRHILPSEDLTRIYLNQVQAVPETLLVNKSGKVVDSVVGAHSKAEWKEIIDKAYGKVTSNDQ